MIGTDGCRTEKFYALVKQLWYTYVKVCVGARHSLLAGSCLCRMTEVCIRPYDTHLPRNY